MKYFAKWTTFVLAACLVGCGGGGGSFLGIDFTSYGLLGFAAKGTLKFATVEVYSLDASGNQVLVKTGETGADGTYSIPDVGTKAGQKYIVKIKPNSKTVHVDELLGDQTLPSDFVMTAVTQTDSKDTTASVTPLSHMIVEAAKNAPGGLNSDNISQAQSTVTEMLGFNPTTIAKNDGATNEAKALTIILTAVSQMAKDGALGCTGSASDKTACVTKTLAAATSTTTKKLETNVAGQTVNVSSAFDIAKEKTLQDPKFQGQSALVATLTSNLNCTTNCTPALVKGVTVGGGGAAPAAPAESPIVKIKAVIDEIRTDLTTMFSSDGATSTSKGKINAQAFKFQESVDGVKFVTDQMARDLSAIDTGIKLYSDYKKNDASSRVTIDTKYGEFAYTSGLNLYDKAAVSCSLYQDVPSPTARLAIVNQNNAAYISCQARYARSYRIINNAPTITYYQHSFTLIPVSGTNASAFTYTTAATKSTITCPTSGSCSAVTPITTGLQLDGGGARITYAGSVNTGSWDGTGHRTYTVSGDLAPGFQLTYNPNGAYSVYSPNFSGPYYYDNQTVSLVRAEGKDSWNLNFALTENTTTSEVTKLEAFGSLASYSGAGNKIAEISLREGSFVDQSANTARLDLAFSSFSSTNTATLTGVLIADTPATDKSQTSTIPTHMQFAGTFSNASGGVQTDFLKGVIDVKIKNYNNFDFTKPTNAANTATEDLTLTGTLTAPNQPRLELIFATSGKAYNLGDTALTASLSYNRYVGSTSTRSVGFTISRATATAKKQATVSEATSGFSMSFTDGDKTTKVYANGSEVGTLDLNSGLLTFKDGSIVSLDIQL